MQRSRRQEAKAALADAAARQEKFYLNNKTYTITLGGVGGLGMQAAAGEYTIAISAATAACPIATCYALTATPTVGGPQTADTKCATLTLNSSGVKGATGSTPNDCW